MGWWQRLRSGRKAALEPNFSGTELAIGEALHIDVHSHIVPGVDDGSSTIEESLELIERLVNMGYRGAVVTPHIHSDIYPNNLLTLVPAFERMLSTSVWRGEDASREGTLRGRGMRVEVPCAHRAFSFPPPPPGPANFDGELLHRYAGNGSG